MGFFQITTKSRGPVGNFAIFCFFRNGGIEGKDGPRDTTHSVSELQSTL